MTASNCPFLTCAPMAKDHFFKYPLVREYTGEGMKGCTFPGRMISSAGAVCFGETTETAVRATCAVSTFSLLRARTRDTMPEAKRAATMVSAIAGPSHRLRGRCRFSTSFDGGVGGGRVAPPLCFFSSLRCDIFTPHKFFLLFSQ